MSFRMGHGYDVHRLTPGRQLILGGVVIPYPQGLLGHSDADVLLHAMMDALLGALALGDIGAHFPDSDMKWRGADSMELLKQCAAMVAQKGYQIGNLDATVIAQRPKIAPYTMRMRKRIAAALELEIEQVSIKATTEEGLGFTGSGEGIAAHCVCLLEQS
jgi:2-C-methyl-D-erythritol 2,4-cyclodiphosphate synthase